MSGKLFPFHRNWELVFRQIGTFHLKCMIRLWFARFFLSPSQVLRLRRFKERIITPLCTYGGRGCGEDTVWFVQWLPWFSVRLEIHQYLPSLSAPSGRGTISRFPFQTKLSKTFRFVLNLIFIIWNQNIFWRTLVYVIKNCLLERQVPVVIHFQNTSTASAT